MINGFFEGLGAYSRAFRTISRMGLWGYALLPALITIALMAGIGYSAFGLSDNLGAWIVGWWRWDWGADFINGLGAWLGGIVIGLLGILLLKYIVLVLVSPFMSILSEKVEANLTGNHSNASFSIGGAISDMIRGLRLAIRNLIRELFFTFLLLLLGLIPLFGWISPVLIFLVQSFYAGFGNADYTLERHYSVGQSVRFARRHKGLMMGNGAVFMLLLMTGVGFLIAPPLATVAATIESVERLEEEAVLV